MNQMYRVRLGEEHINLALLALHENELHAKYDISSLTPKHLRYVSKMAQVSFKLLAGNKYLYLTAQ
jgi:hypothetical protein